MSPPVAPSGEASAGKPRRPPRLRWTLWLAILSVAALVRLGSVVANDLPHGDVHVDRGVAASVAAGRGLHDPVERVVAFYPEPDDGWGHPADQHPPLLPLIAATLVRAGLDPYLALRLVTWAFGLLLVLECGLLASGVGSRCVFWAAAAAALSFLLVDFSGNGSVYVPEAAMLLAALLALRRPGLSGPFLAGAALGAACLFNLQALALAPALPLALALPVRREGRAAALRAVVALGGTVLALLPYLARNAAVFGDPLFSVNPLYLKWRLGWTPRLLEEAGGLRLVLEAPPFGQFVRAGLANAVVNVRFLGSQAALWAGPILPLAAAGLLVRPHRGRRGPAHRTLVALLLLQTGVMLAWPALKFRSLAPWLALLVPPAARALVSPVDAAGRRAAWAALGACALVGLERLARGGAVDALWIFAGLALSAWALGRHPRPRPVRSAAVFLLLQAVLVLSAPRPPSAYYDGILVSDAFGRRGAEAIDRARERALRRLLHRATLPEGGAVAGPPSAATYLPGGVRAALWPEFLAGGDVVRAARYARERLGVDRVVVGRAGLGRLEEGGVRFEILDEEPWDHGVWTLVAFERS